MTYDLKPVPRGYFALLLAAIFAVGIVLGDWVGSCAGGQLP